jgi:dTDP-4-amino-4,6-dideoxygalactose transaminase
MSGKHHATGGQGGVVFTRNEDYYWAARRASDRGKPFGIQGESTYVTAAHNLNLNDLSAAIGREQLKKLPKTIEACRCVGFSIADKCRDLKSVSVDLGPPESQSVFWFVTFRVDTSKLSCDYGAFVSALAAEGAPFAGPYVKPITQQTWYQKKDVFGDSGYPWAAPEYKGDPNADYPTPNWEQVNQSVFRLKVHEGCGEQEAEDAVAILRKVEAHYLK